MVARVEDASGRAAPRSRTTVRISILLILVAALVGPISTRGAEQASASSGDEAAFVEALNRIRADVDLPALTVNHQLSDLARIHTEHMADAGEIAHATPISAGYEGPWTKLGENVGVGAEVEDLVDAFVASPGHYANLVDPAFTEIGVGVVRRSDALYTTHRFLEPPVDAGS